MPPRPAHDFDSLLLSAEVRVDEVCRRFEAVWKTGARPRIEDFLPESAGAERLILLRELILLDVCYRRGVNEAPRAEEYRERFPEADVDLAAESFNARSCRPTSVDLRAGPAAVGPATSAITGSFDDYDQLELIGRGGMGVVYRARQIRLNRLVALKMIRAGEYAGPADLERFRTEAEVVARIRHPNIVQIHEVGEHQGLPFLSLEYVEGGNLHGKLQGAPLPPRIAARLTELLARGMQAAHEQGVLHRDLKPANVFLQPAREESSVPIADGDGKVTHYLPKIGDFGLAKKLDDPRCAPGTSAIREDALTQTGAIVGTPSYMAPEQARGTSKEIGPAADVYALGAILYELLTGRPPFKAATALDTALQVINDEPAPVRQLQSKTPRDLETICLKCLQKTPHKRYATALALAEDLRCYLAGEPIAARPTGLVERGWRWCRRNALAATLLAAVAMTLLLGAGSASILAVAAAHHASRADEEATGARLAQEQSKQDAEDARQARDQATEAEGKWKAQSLRAQWLAYAGKITLAQHAWKYGDGATAWRHLRSCQADLRGWEYDYLHTLFRRHQRTFRGHSGALWCVVYSPDGKRIASAGADRTVKVWDAAHGAARPLPHGTQRCVSGVAFSHDGERLASASFDKTVKVWDSRTGKTLRTLEGHTHGIWSVAFNRDGTRLASASEDHTVKVWDAHTGREVFAFKGHTRTVAAVAFSPDGRRIASASHDQTVKVWDAASGEQSRSFSGHQDHVHAVAFSPDGRRIASASQLLIKVWDAETGLETFSAEGHSAAFSSVTFNFDGTRLAAANFDAVIRVWDLADRREAFFLQGHLWGVRSVAFSPDGERLASASEDETVKVWEVGKEQEARWGHTLLQKPGLVVRQGPPLETFTFGHKWWVQSVAFSPDSRRLASASQDQTVKVWDPGAGKEVLTLAGHAAAIRSVAFSPDGKRIASASHDQTVKVWDVDTGQAVLSRRYGAAVRSVAFSPAGKRIASGAADGTVTVWPLGGAQPTVSFKAHRGIVHCVAFSPDGKRIASAGQDQTLKVWDSVTGQGVLSLVGHTGPVRSVVFRRDGKRLASASNDQTVKVWDSVTGGNLLTFQGHTHFVTCVAFSPDGKRIASGSDDLTVKVWEAERGQEVLSLTGHTYLVTSVAFSPDGRRLASASDDWTIKVWDARK